MVMKSQFAKEKQKPHQLHGLYYSHPQPLHQPVIPAEEALHCKQVKVGLCSSDDQCFATINDDYFSNSGYIKRTAAVVNANPRTGPNKKVPFKGSEKSRPSSSIKIFQSVTSVSRLAFIVLVVISLLADKLVHGANVNSTLAVDLLMNSNHGDGGSTSAESINSFVPSTSTSPTPTTTTTTTGSSNSNITIISTTIPTANDTSHNTRNNSSTTTPLPSYANYSNIANLNISYDHDKTTTSSSAIFLDGSSTSSHINFSLPIQVTPDSSFIVKQGSIIYEVINNGTVSTNYRAFAIPFISPPAGTGTRKGATSRSDPRMAVYEQMTATILGLRVEETAKGVTYENGASKILANSPAVIRFFGVHFTNSTIVRFVTEEGERGEDCDDVSSSKYFHFDTKEMTQHSALTTVTIPPLNDGEHKFYVCVREDNAEMPWIHQGPEQWIVITTYQKWLPIWAHIALLLLLLLLSGLFSGLNLGLMAIDRTEIKIIINAGSEKDRRYAKQIQPLRDNGNYLLCSLLLGNVLVNATLTILLDDLTSGLIAVIGSTVGIVIFGEIVPQAVCSRHGLAVGAKTVLITKFFMAVTFPLSYPISVILNKVLGEEIGNVYNRERLKELIRVTQGVNDLEKDEVNIISGALDLKQKTVVDVMTRLEDVYMLPIDAVLDFDTVSEIMSNGYSRIPVYDNERSNVVSLLYAKDLAFVDPDDKMPLRTICEFYSNPCHFVFENVTLNVLFNVFKQGNKGHMAFVQRVKASDKVDPTYEVIGLVTMEDVIEELIQEEINDETDVWELDNKRRSQGNYSAITDVTMPNLKNEGDGTTVSPQLTLAAFQYLSTAVEEFHDPHISKSVLERMLKQNIYFHIKFKVKDSGKIDPNTILYERGKPADYFIMILEGRVHAEIGKENLVFESGPFSYFGTKALLLPPTDGTTTPTPAILRKTSQISQISYSESAMLPTFIPDYTVRAVTDLTYFQISRSMYLAAKQATLLEKTYSSADSGLCDDRIDEQSTHTLDEVLEASEGKPKETSITMAKSTGRGSISENYVKGAKEGSRNVGLATMPPPSVQQQLKQMHTPVIGDNNNICKATFATNGELVTQELGGSNMSRVILCPLDEHKPPSCQL